MEKVWRDDRERGREREKVGGERDRRGGKRCFVAFCGKRDFVVAFCGKRDFVVAFCGKRFSYFLRPSLCLISIVSFLHMVGSVLFRVICSNILSSFV